MSIVRRYTFTGKGRVTALYVDQASLRLYVGVQNTTGSQLLIKSATNPNDTLYTIDITCDEIKGIAGDSTHVYLALDDNKSIGCRISKSSPSTPTYISIPTLVNESPIRVAVGAYLLFLTPGDVSGEYTRVIRYNKTTLALVSNYELQGGSTDITYATGMDVDDSDNVWVCTYTSPTKLVKINSDFSSYSVWNVE